jgi:hypothetical protein
MDFTIKGKSKKYDKMIERFQKNILFWDIKSENAVGDGKGAGYCSNMGSRTCLTCDKCWGMREKARGI